MKILVVEDEEAKRLSLAEDLRARGDEVTDTATAETALACLKEACFDAVVSDLRLPGIDGLELLKRIRASGDMLPPEVILMTAYGSIPLAVDAMKAGAFDFVAKPFPNKAIFPILNRIAKERWAQAPNPKEAAPGAVDVRVVGNSAVMRRVKKMIEISARSPATVLLTGETGTGKDLVASAIHALSPRHSGPFVKVCCAVLPQHLIESELYGHEKGSFTGAHRGHRGRFAQAEGGTLYLDDVDDIPFEQQVKLLRVIEEKVFEPVGGGAPRRLDVRIVAATKQDLLTKTKEGSFRSDLYYRLNVLRIGLPPLRERLEDLPLLAEHVLHQLADGRTEPLQPSALAVLASHTWPGNVREFAHVLERALLVGEGRITESLLRNEVEELRAAEDRGPDGPFRNVLRETERQMLEDALIRFGGNQSAAAKSLGIKRSTFRDRCMKYGLS